MARRLPLSHSWARAEPICSNTVFTIRVSGLDVWLAAGGSKNMSWSRDEVQIRTFKHALAWAPELIGLAREKAGGSLH